MIFKKWFRNARVRARVISRNWTAVAGPAARPGVAAHLDAPLPALAKDEAQRALHERRAAEFDASKWSLV